MPAATRIRQLITEGKVGKIVSVDLNWCVDTYHGSSYFQRWNRERKLSGGLSVHKSCHHLDLVQWWIDQKPEEVFSYGTRTFFGSNGIHNPLTQEQIGDGRTCPTCDCREKCRYYMQWFREEFRGGKADENLDQFASAARTYTGYSHRQCIYDPEIDIEDNYAAVIRYDDGAVLNYSVNFSTPYEGFRLAINGTEGRIEFNEIHAPNRLPFPASEVDDAISYFPLFGGREKIDVLNQGGNHGGGDPLLLDELFIGPDPTCSTPRQASFSEGIDVVLTGLAISRSVQENRPIPMQEMRAEVYKNKTV